MLPTGTAAQPIAQRARLSLPVCGEIFQKIWKKICDTVSKIFSEIADFFKGKSDLSAKDIKIIIKQKDKSDPLHTDQTGSLTDKGRSIETYPPNHTRGQHSQGDIDLNNPEPPYNTFDESLENLRSFIREFSALGTNVVFEKYISGHVESAQTLAPSLPPVIKSVAKLLVEMGDKASKPLFKRFSGQKARTIDPALQKIFNTLLKPNAIDLKEKLSVSLGVVLENAVIEKGLTFADYINPLLEWVSKPEEQRTNCIDFYPENKKFNYELIAKLCIATDSIWSTLLNTEKENLYLSLQQQLCSEFVHKDTPDMNKLKEEYIKVILAWLLLSNHAVPLNDVIGSAQADQEELIDIIFEKALTLLVENKIDQYSRFLEKTIQGHLGDIVLKMLQKNATRISDFFSERISELVTSMPFSITIDSLIHDAIFSQIQGIIELEKIPKEEKKSKQLEVFSTHNACSAYVKEIISQEAVFKAQEKDPNLARIAGERAFYSNVAEIILNLMTPMKKIFGEDGTIQEIDPFIELWDRLYFPDEFHELVKLCEDLAQEFINPETTALLEKIRLPTAEIIKNLFKTTAKEQLKKKLVVIVQKGIEKITVPEKIDEINAENTFRALNLILIEAFAKKQLIRDLPRFIPLFHNQVSSRGHDQKKHFRIIQNALIKLTKSRFKHFKPANFYCEDGEENSQPKIKEIALSPLEWLEITRSIVSDIQQMILHAEINEKPLNMSTITPSEINLIIKKGLESASAVYNPNFGQFAMDLIFQLGKMDNEWLINTFVKKSISESVTENIEPWRTSHHLMIDKAANVAKRSFLDIEVVRELLSDDPPKKSPLIKQRLAHQVNVTACLAHDFIMGMAAEKGAVASFGAAKILTDNPLKIQKIISRIYKKTLGNLLLNQNLAVNLCENIFQSFLIAAENVKAKENMRVHQMAVMSEHSVKEEILLLTLPT